MTAKVGGEIVSTRCINIFCMAYPTDKAS